MICVELVPAKFFRHLTKPEKTKCKNFKIFYKRKAASTKLTTDHSDRYYIYPNFKYRIICQLQTK